MRTTFSFPRLLGVAIAALMVVPLFPLPAAAPPLPDTVGLVDPATGIWRLRTDDGSIATFYYGNPGDYPFAGDWDCDGVDTPGLYRQSDGFVYLRNSNTQGPADLEFFFGNPGDVPLAGDFNNDGCDTVSIYRPSESRIYVINELGEDGGGLGAADYHYDFGNPGDVPYNGDFNGNGTDTTGLYRASSGFTYLRQTNTTGIADLAFYFGNPGDRFVAGDWDADGVDTPGVFRPSNNTFYLKNTNSQGNAEVEFGFGQSGWLPIAGKWGDIDAVPPITLELVESGFDQPIFADAPAGDSRLFVAEKTGRIKIIKGGNTLPTPFLNLSTLVSTNNERGLLGLAFHPNYAANGRFFVHYTNTAGDTRVVEYFAAGGGDVASSTPVQTLLSVNQPEPNHNGGMIEFGPDGFLYISLGDGGGSPGNRAQDTNDLLGSIVRLDVDKVAPNNAAAGNPYIGKAGDDRIWAIGLRNPWRTAIDPVNNVIVSADVGQDRREEVNIAALSSAGVNYGWQLMEGSLCYPSGSSCGAGLTLPAHEYTHSEGQSISGGYVYNGTELPELTGRYFYGDFISGFIRSFVVSGTSAVGHLNHDWDLGTVAVISSFGTDGAGELYVVSYGGSIYKIVRETK
ncbi:MAG: PQQ-dependent sugar dehydrogenase [Acidimicrobiia bacterium]